MSCVNTNKQRRAIWVDLNPPLNKYDIWLKQTENTDNNTYQFYIYDELYNEGNVYNHWQPITTPDGGGQSQEYLLFFRPTFDNLIDIIGLITFNNNSYQIPSPIKYENNQVYLWYNRRWNNLNITPSTPDESNGIKARNADGQDNYGTIQYQYPTSANWQDFTNTLTVDMWSNSNWQIVLDLITSWNRPFKYWEIHKGANTSNYFLNNMSLYADATSIQLIAHYCNLIKLAQFSYGDFYAYVSNTSDVNLQTFDTFVLNGSLHGMQLLLNGGYAPLLFTVNPTDLNDVRNFDYVVCYLQITSNNINKLINNDSIHHDYLTLYSYDISTDKKAAIFVFKGLKNWFINDQPDVTLSPLLVNANSYTLTYIDTNNATATNSSYVYPQQSIQSDVTFETRANNTLIAENSLVTIHITKPDSAIYNVDSNHISVYKTGSTSPVPYTINNGDITFTMPSYNTTLKYDCGRKYHKFKIYSILGMRLGEEQPHISIYDYKNNGWHELTSGYDSAGNSLVYGRTIKIKYEYSLNKYTFCGFKYQYSNSSAPINNTESLLQFAYTTDGNARILEYTFNNNTIESGQYLHIIPVVSVNITQEQYVVLLTSYVPDGVSYTDPNFNSSTIDKSDIETLFGQFTFLVSQDDTVPYTVPATINILNNGTNNVKITNMSFRSDIDTSDFSYDNLQVFDFADSRYRILNVLVTSTNNQKTISITLWSQATVTRDLKIQEQQLN